MKILYYNWVPFDDDEKRGGGVSVYQRNLIEAFICRGQRVDFFSAGLSYRVDGDEVEFVETENVFSRGCRSFVMVNSPVMSPGHSAFGRNFVLFERGVANERFFEFIEKYGPYDVIHFNNIEGIPFTFLELKKRFPEVLVVFSHHNYFPFCPQVNFWFQEREHCADFDRGRKCAVCLPYEPRKTEVLAAQQLTSLLNATGVGVRDSLFGKAFSEGSTVRLFEQLNIRNRRTEAQDDRELPLNKGGGASFLLRRERALALLNSEVDLHLAVSRRVARIICSYGLDSKKVRVSYIGTKHGEMLRQAVKRQGLRQSGQLSICYLGYMRADKGFFFFLDALESMSSDVAAKIRIKIAARSNGDPRILSRIVDLERKFAEVQHIDGYGHTELPNILADVDLGIVPVLWEDNLPQVAIEIMSHGVPVLSANKGGAQELGANPDFVFTAGSHGAFHHALRRLADEDVALSSFWEAAMPLRSMDDHVEELIGLYHAGLEEVRNPISTLPTMPSEQAPTRHYNTDMTALLSAHTIQTIALLHD